MEAGRGQRSGDSCQPGLPPDARRRGRVRPRRFQRGTTPPTPRFQTPGPQNDETVGGPSRGQPEGTDAGDPSRPLPGPVAFRGHGTHPVLPAGSFSLHTGSQGAPPLCAHGNPQAHLGPAIWATARPKAGAGLVTHSPTGPPPPSRPGASGGAGGLTGALSSLALAAAGTDLPVWPPENGSKAAARPTEPTALPLRGLLAPAFPPPMGRAFPSPVLGLGLLAPSWAGSPLESPLPSSVRGQVTPTRFQKPAPARVPALQ